LGIERIPDLPRSKISDFWATPFWEKIPDKPSEFPPTPHSHVRSDISDFWSTPFWEKIPDKPSEFSPKAHAPTHGVDGSDPVSLDASQIVSGVLNKDRIPKQSTYELVDEDTGTYYTKSTDFVVHLGLWNSILKEQLPM